MTGSIKSGTWGWDRLVEVCCPNAVAVPGGKKYLDNPERLYVNYLVKAFKDNLINYRASNITRTERGITMNYAGYKTGNWIPIV